MSNRRLLMQILRIYIFFACNEIANMSIYAITPFIYTEPHEFTVGPHSATIDVANIYNYNNYQSLELNSGDTLYVVGCELFAETIYSMYYKYAINIYIDKINQIPTSLFENVLISNLYIANSPEQITLKKYTQTIISLQTTTSITMQNSTISDFSGCPALTELHYTNSTSPTSLTFANNGENIEILDLTNNTGIQTLSFTPNSLKQLIIPGTSITDIQTLISNATQLQILNISNAFTGSTLTLPASITNVNVSNNSSLTSITGFTDSSIISLDISATGITLNDFSTYTSMTNLNVEGNNTLTTLTIPSSLTSLNANGLTNLTTIDGIANISQFVSFQIGSTLLTGFTDFSNCANLTTLDLSNKNLTNIILPTTSNAWEILNLNGNNALNLTLPQFIGLNSLKVLNVGSCDLITTVIVKDCPNAVVTVPTTAEVVNLINVYGGTYDFSGFTNLTELISNASNTQIPTSSTALTKLLSYGANIAYNLGTNYPNLTSFTCVNPNSVTWSSGNDKITELSILNAYSSSFTIDVTALPVNLTKFSLTGNTSITECDLTNYTSLTYLDVSGCSNLSNLSYPDTITYLDISGTKISEINSNILPNLTYLNINQSQVQSLTIQYSTNLTYVNIGSIKSVDLQGCSNTKIDANNTISAYIRINLNGCNLANIANIQLDETTEFADLTNIASVDNLNCAPIDFTSEAFMGVLNANQINTITLKLCTAGNIDLSNKSTENVTIVGGQYESISLPNTLTSISVESMQTPISIQSCQSFRAFNSNVSCETINGSKAISLSNNGIIGDITMSNLIGPEIIIENCNSININNCLNINMLPSIEYQTYTYGSSISIINSTFSSASIDFSGTSIDLTGSTFSQNKDNKVYIKNYNAESIDNFQTTLINELAIRNCPNFNLENTTLKDLYIINSNTTYIPPQIESLVLIDCNDINNFIYDISQSEIIIIQNCSNLNYIDFGTIPESDFCTFRIIGNKNLKYIKYNTIEYGKTEPIDNLMQLMPMTSVLRFNGFENVNYISNPNFVNEKLIYSADYFVNVASDEDAENKLLDIIKNGMVKIQGELNKGTYQFFTVYCAFMDLNNQYNIILPFENNLIAFTQLSEDGLANLKQQLDSLNLFYPALVVTEYPTSAFNDLKRRDNISIISLSGTPQPPLEPNVFSINLIINEQ